MAACECSSISSFCGQPFSTASRKRCSEPTPGLPPHEKTSFFDAAHADELVVDQVRRHADQRQVLAALADDLVARGMRNEVGEAFQRHRVAVANGVFDGFGERRNTRHEDCFPVAAPYLRLVTGRVKWRYGRKFGLQRMAAMLGKEPIFTIHAELADIMNLGRTPYGERRVIGILGGSVRGPKLHGRILPGGADWQIIRSDGAADIQARYTIETDAGARILVVSDGLRHGPPDVMERLARGDNVDPALYYFRTVMRFETADPAVGLAQPHSGAGARTARSPRRAARCLRGRMMADRLDMKLPASLAAERQGAVAILRLARPQKRNALDDETILGIETFFTSLPDGIGAVLLHGEGEHFSAGLDLSELEERDVAQGIAHSGLWHRAFEKIQFGKVPVVAVLHGAVVGGGLELAAAAHVRVAERSAYYALPEGSRGIYVGGGGSVRLPRLIGVARMMDMMLTGRTYSAEEGQAMGLTTYLVEPGAGLRQRPRTRASASPAMRR